MLGAFLTGGSLALVLLLSIGVQKLIYGAEGLRLRKESGAKNNVPLVFIMLLLMVWLVTLILAIVLKDYVDWRIVIAALVGIPILLVLWGIVVRRRVKKELEEEARPRMTFSWQDQDPKQP